MPASEKETQIIQTVEIGGKCRELKFELRSVYEFK